MGLSSAGGLLLLKNPGGRSVGCSETCGFGGGGAGRFRSVNSGFSAARVTGKRKNESTPVRNVQKAMAKTNLFIGGK